MSKLLIVTMQIEVEDWPSLFPGDGFLSCETVEACDVANAVATAVAGSTDAAFDGTSFGFDIGAATLLNAEWAEV
jgi:hypothetical protein